MKSHQAIKAAVEDKGAKHVADALGVSTSLVYKWCEDAGEGSGAPNPLDRVAALVTASSSTVPLQWLCEQAKGAFVARLDPAALDGKRVLAETQRVLKEFSDVLAAITAAFVDDRVTKQEAEVIRKEWEELVRVAEGLVQACESQAVHPKKNER